MTKLDQEMLEEFGRELGQSVFPAMLHGRLAVSIGGLTTADSDRAYLALRHLEAEAKS